MITRLLRRLKLWLLLMLALPLLLLGTAQWMLSRAATPAALVARVESTYNCRAEVTAASANLWRLPAQISLSGLKLAPRDADADTAKPLGERSLLAGKSILVAVDQLTLELNLWAVLTRSLNIQKLLVQRVNILCENPVEGPSELHTLFTRPSIVAGQPNPALTAKTEPPTAPATPEPAHEFHARDLPLAPEIAQARLEQVRVDFKNMKSRQVLRFENANLDIQQLLIDSGNLAQKNHAALGLDGRFQIIGKDKVRQVDLGVQIHADTAPFDPRSGTLKALPFQVRIAQGSTLQDLPALQKISEKIQKWERYGLLLAPLPDQIIIDQNLSMDVIYGGHQLTTQTDFTLPLQDYELTLHQGSWCQTVDETCLLDLQIKASPAVSSRALAGLTASITQKIGTSLGTPAAEKLIASLRAQGLILPDGRLSVPMTLTGPVGKPKVEDQLTGILMKAVLDGVLGGLGL